MSATTLAPDQHAVIKTTTEQLGARLDELESAARRIIHIEYLGGRDWIVVAGTANPHAVINRQIAASGGMSVPSEHVVYGKGHASGIPRNNHLRIDEAPPVAPLAPPEIELMPNDARRTQPDDGFRRAGEPR